MRKSFIYTAILLLAGVVTTACSGSDDMNDVATEQQKSAGNATVELVGTLGGKSDQTRAIDANGVGSWEIGDRFAIYYETANGHATAIATVNSVNSDGSANFKAMLSAPKTGDNDVALVYPASAHDGNGGINTDALMSQEGTIDYINANGLDIERATTTMTVDGSKASLKSNVTMQPQVCLYTMTVRDASNPNDILNTTKLEITCGSDNYTVIPKEPTNIFTVALLPVNQVTCTFTATTTQETSIRTKVEGVTLANCTPANVGQVFDMDGNIYDVSWGPGAVFSRSWTYRTLLAGKLYTSYLSLNRASNAVTAVGMIAYVGDHGTVDDSSTNAVTGYHGLAIGMADLGGFSGYKWCSSGSRDCTSGDGDTDRKVSDPATACVTLNGISITDSLVKHSDGGTTHLHSAAIMAHSTTGHPSTTSDWFLPSVGQWQLIFQGVVSKATGTPYTTPITTTLTSSAQMDLFNSVLDHAGVTTFPSSGCHWLSTEASVGKAWAVATDGYAFAHDKTWSAVVRRTLAF